jgi:protein-disulfide isomerase
MRSIASRLPRWGLVVALLSLSLAACHKSGGPLTTDDMSQGNPNAKVTVVEYASVGCPVCGRWDTDIFPSFKAKYIDTGRVHYVFREMLVGGSEEVNLGASGFLLARCAGKDKYFAVTDAIFHVQPDIYGGKIDAHKALLNVAQSVGMNEDQFNACITNDAALTALQKRAEDHAVNDHVDSTPTFVINGVALTPGYHQLSDLDAAIAAAH